MSNLYVHEQDLEKDLKNKRITVNEKTLLLLAMAINKVNSDLDKTGSDRLDYNTKTLVSISEMSKVYLWSCDINDEIIAALLFFRDIHYNNQPRILRAIKDELFGTHRA